MSPSYNLNVLFPTGPEADERGDIRVLDAATWQQRRQRLQDLGGPPEE